MKRLFSIVLFGMMMTYNTGSSRAYNMFTPMIVDLNDEYVPEPFKLKDSKSELNDIKAKKCLYILINS